MDSSRGALMQACLHAINVVYSVTLVAVLPPVLWFFLFLDMTFAGVIALGCAAIYAPALLGFFPRQADRRIGLACALMILVALAVNSAGGWQVQPGLWLLVVPCFLVGISLWTPSPGRFSGALRAFNIGRGIQFGSPGCGVGPGHYRLNSHVVGGDLD